MSASGPQKMIWASSSLEKGEVDNADLHGLIVLMVSGKIKFYFPQADFL